MRYAVRMWFNSPVHLGEFGIGEEAVSRLIHSDTWYSAVTSAIRQLYGPEKVKKWVAELESYGAEDEGTPPPMRITSAFPMRRVDAGGGIRYYLPKPLLPPAGMDDIPGLRETWGKKIKRAEYLSLPLWRKWVSGTALSEEDYREIDRIHTEELGPFLRTSLITRVTLDRATAASAYFRQGLWMPGDGVGLFLLADIPEVWLEVVRAAWRWLGDSGIGGKRSIGYGQFHVDMQALHEGLPGDDPATQFLSVIEPDFEPDGYLLLSLYYPAPAERARSWEGATVLWLDRRGWSSYGDGVHAKRKSVRMLAEGSVLPWRPRGAVVDVTPSVWRGHRSIHRSGIAYAVPVRSSVSGEPREGGRR